MVTEEEEGGYGSAGGTGSIDGGDRNRISQQWSSYSCRATYGDSALTKLYFGSGGGGGGSYSGTNAGCASSDAECNKGGNGAGILYILPLTLLITTLVLHYHLMVNWVSLNPEQQDAALTQLPTPKMEAVHQVQAVLYICQPIV